VSVDDGNDVARSSLSLGDRMGSGGQGDVYDVGGDLLFKEYKQPATANGPALAALPAFRQRLSPEGRDRLDGLAAWPLCRVTDGGRAVGLLMRRAPSRLTWQTPNGRTKLLELQYALHKPKNGTRTVPQPTPDQRRALAIACVEAIDWFHSAGMVIGDISHANILWALTPEPSVYFIDCDGCRPVGGSAVQVQADTPDWGDPQTPSSQACVDSDAYKTALAAVRILTQNPYAMPGQDLNFVPGCLNERQEKAVRALFQQAGGPRNTRPKPAEWRNAFSDRGTIQLNAAKPRERPVVNTAVLDGVRDRKRIPLRGR
jgi:hypothetical protein